MPASAYDAIIVLSLICGSISIPLVRRANDREKVFLYYVIAIATFEILAVVLNKLLENGNNLPGLHAFTLVQFVLLSLFFHQCMKELTSWFKYKWILIIGSVGIILNSLLVQSVFTYNTYSKSIVELYIIVMSVVLFVLFLKDKSHDQMSMKASVSFVSAVFLQASVSIIFYLYSNELLEMKISLSTIAWNLKLGINYLSLFIIMLGMWQIHTRRKAKLAK